jgi:hypothetical protein
VRQYFAVCDRRELQFSIRFHGILRRNERPQLRLGGKLRDSISSQGQNQIIRADCGPRELFQ